MIPCLPPLRCSCLLLLGFALMSCGGGSTQSPAAGSSTASASGTTGSGVVASGSSGSGSAGGTSTPTPSPTPSPSPTSPADVLTWHYDAMRSGLNNAETALTLTTVNSTRFGKLGEFTVDCSVDAQPLYLSQLAISGLGTHNVLYVATQQNSLYALDADSLAGTSATVLWQKSLLPAGEATVLAADLPCGSNATNGIMATPVIDRSRNAIYVVAFSKDSGGVLRYRLHALDLGTGAELSGGPVVITASGPGTGGNSSGGIVTFLPSVQQERAALLETSGGIVLTWGGRDGDCGRYSSWVMSYNPDTLVQTSAVNLVPHDQGAGIWMSGAGPAMDASGDLYLVTGNAFVQNGDGTPATGSYSNSVVRMSGSGTLAQVDYFTPYNTAALNAADLDLDGGGPLLLPDQLDNSGATRHLALLAGKDSNIYLVDRDNLGHFGSTSNAIVQQLNGQLDGHEFHSAPVAFNGSVYFTARGSALKVFSLNAAHLSTSPTSQSKQSFSGGIPVITANAGSNGIVWVDEGGSAVLYAYDAGNLGHLLYSSSQAANGRDQFRTSSGPSKTPLVIDGRVYLGTAGSIAVFGLLP